MTNVDEFLEHHGVKGQKWGTRKTALVVGSGVVGAFIASRFLVGLPGTAVGAAAGVGIANRLLKDQGEKKLSEITRPV